MEELYLFGKVHRDMVALWHLTIINTNFWKRKTITERQSAVIDVKEKVYV